MLNGVDYESYFSPRPTSRPRGKGKAKVEPRNKGRGKTKPKLDLDRLAVQDGTSVASAGSDEAVSIFLELQNRRNERRGAMFSNIDSLFSTFEKLDGLTPEMRAQAAEARKVLIQDINDISHEAMTAQLMEMKRQERALETDDEATGADLARLMSRSPLAATVASWMDDIEENEKGGEDEDEEIKDRDKKKADKNMDNANSSAGFRKHDGSEDGSTSSGSLQSEEGPSSDEAGSTAGVLEQYPWVGSGSSDGFDGDEDENEVEME